MSIVIRRDAVTHPKKAKAALKGDLTFGTVFTDLMFIAEHDEGTGWHDARIAAFEDLRLSPSAKVFHYGLEIFEGFKAYRREGGDIALFRPTCNAERLNRSAARMTLAEVPIDLQIEAAKLLVDAVRDWVPQTEGASLYLRPTLIGTEPALGVKPSRKHLFFIIASPVGGYFKNGVQAISVRVEDQEVRAAAGGAGFAKAGGNYGAAMLGKRRAMESGFDEVMWLDAEHRRYIEELGAMNIFAVRDGVIVTPPLSSTILDGVTRRSLLELAPRLGFPVSEERMDIDTFMQDAASGRISEAAAVGTAAVVTPVGRIGYKQHTVVLGNGNGRSVMEKLRCALTDIQYGRAEDPFGWMHPVHNVAADARTAIHETRHAV